MRKYRKAMNIIFISGLLLIICGCDNQNAPFETWGTACATLNGEKWKAKPRATYSHKNHYDTISMRIEVEDKDGILINSLLIANIPKKIGGEVMIKKYAPIFQQPDKESSSSFDTSHGDTPIDKYEIDTTQTSTFRLTRFNEKTKVLEAEFDLHFVKGPGISGLTFPDPNAPEKLHFQDGHLKTKIMD
ncbi:MAG: hypothetical protein K1X92_08570 [Bacteroidia bacterium]|nr:hypothetical protein [Bacteroidia bacterium]